MKLTQERLKELLYYNHETGLFVWKVCKASAKKGNIAGCLDKTSGYWKIKIDGKNYQIHRLVFLYIEGYIPENGVDHIDRNKINNRYNNLREVSQTCNLRNRDVFKNNKSKITGVSWYKTYNKWESKINILKKCVHLGYFDNLLDAVKARWDAEVKYNFPNCNTTSSAYVYLKEQGVNNE